MIKTIIVEDEKKSREVLNKLIEKNCPDLNVVGTAASVGVLEDIHSVELVVERVEPIARRSLRFGVQRLP
mgnify:CR=1 FL=1